MKIELWWIGKTNTAYLKEGISIYSKRISKYTKFEIKELADHKNASKISTAELKIKEGQRILEKVQPKDFIILLDENGKSFDSVNFSKYIEKLLISSQAKVIFIIGGAFGFSKEVYYRANLKIAMSPMTFSHQMIRLIFTEQLYRTFSIINNEPYHHK